MILGRFRLFFLARIGATCLGIAAFAHPVPAQVFESEGGRPRPAGPPNAAMIVAGRVKDADGKPVHGARVVVVTSEPARSARPMGMCLRNGLPLAIESHGPRRDGRTREVRARRARQPFGRRVYGLRRARGSTGTRLR